MKKLSPQQSGKLGGLRAGMNKELCRERGQKGADTLRERYGKEHFTRLAMRRWGYRVAVTGEKGGVTENS